MRYADYSGVNPPEIREYESFNDESDIADYAVEMIKRAYKMGIIGGKPQNLFDPQGPATRAEFSAILHRYLSK